MLDRALSVHAEGDTAVDDIALCKRVFETLSRFYPGHMWMVGANHEAGVVSIDLPFSKPYRLRNWGMLLHLKGIDEPAQQRKVRHAGGELLERFGVARGPAGADDALVAKAHGLDTGNAVLKSRYGGL